MSEFRAHDVQIRAPQEIADLINKLAADSKRLDTVLSWHGVIWFFAWFQDAENTSPPTRDDIDKLEENYE